MRRTLRAATCKVFRFALRERAAISLRHFLIAETGSLHERRRSGVQEPLLHEASLVVANRLGIDAASLRMLTQTLVFAGAKFACASDEEVRFITGQPRGEGGDALLANHFADLVDGYLAEAMERKSAA